MECIDPWLLSHQSCPLCNRNILLDAIPSISSNVSITMHEQSAGPRLQTNNQGTIQR